MSRVLAGLVGLTVTLFASSVALHAQQWPPTPASKNAQIFKLLRLDGNLVRWRYGHNSHPITYRLLDGFRAFEGARNCRKMTSIDDLAKRSHLEITNFRTALGAAFAMWEQAANIKFREAQEGETPNIIIGAQQEPEGWAFADVFYDAAAKDEFKPISLALVCLNPAKSWKVGFDGNLQVYDLRYTLAHEIGHAIGLDHPDTGGQIMGYRYEERFSDLQAGDVNGATALYGAPRLSDRAIMATAPRPEPSPAAPASGTAALNPTKPD